MSDIILDGISKSFPDKQVLDGLSLTFEESRITCVKGPSGCGKTTLLRIMAGLEEADSGTISGIPEKTAFVFQEDRLCEDFSALRNLLLVTGRDFSREDALSHLAELGLADSASKPVRELSGGMKRRVAIARAVCFGADLILLDEPFKGLDVKLREDVMNYIKRRTQGKTIICVTHDPSEAAFLGGRLIDLGNL